ncbi:RND transporter [Lewinellaceae bacterium SD302]|nr:RND transporter [Lewinellaceae bacterium SD302]
MKSFISYFIKYPVAANLLMAGLLLIGGFSLLQMKSTFFPEFPSRIISIQVIYPGASPEEVEEGIVNKIEENLKGLTGVERYTSISRENSGSVTVEVLKDYDADLVLNDVKNAVDQISSFPVGIEPPVVYKQEQLGRALTFSLSGDGVDLLALKTKARQIEDELMAIDGVSQITLGGFPDEEIEIAFRESDLQAYNITFQEAANAVSRTNVDVTGGTIKGQQEELLLRARNKNYYAEGLRDIVVKTTPGGGQVKLYQIADIKDQFADQPNSSFLDGQPAVSVQVQNTLEEDMLYITDTVKAYLADWNAANENIQATIVNDASITLRQRINTLQSNGIQGFIIVILLLAMFLHWRLAWWVALSIPISFAGMFILANALDVTLNVISLFGMIIVIGILVDDGIVIGENIYSNHEKGEERNKAALNGTMQVLPAVFAAIITTVIAFSSFLFIDGQLGDFFSEMALVVIFSLVFSLVEGAVILPTHVAHSKALDPDAKPNFVQRKFEDLMAWLRDKLYSPALRFAMREKFITFAASIAVLMLSFGAVGGGFVKTTFFPVIERDDIAVTLQLPAGTPEDVTLGILKKIEVAAAEVNEEISKRLPEGEEIIERVELSVGPTTYQGTATVALLPGEFRGDIGLRDVANALREATGPIDEAEVLSFGGSSVFGKPVSVSLVGSDIKQLEEATQAVKAELMKMAELSDVVDNNQEGLREINISLKEKAKYLGLDLQNIVGQVRAGFFGFEAQRLQRGEDEIRVWTRFAESDRRSLTDLNRMRIRLPDGSNYPVSELAELELQRGVIAINHTDGRREVKVEADVANNAVSVTDVTTQIQGEILPRVLAEYPGVATVPDGQVRQQQKSITSVQRVIPVVLLLMFFVVAITFRSIMQAASLFALLPFGFIGVVFGHWLMGAPISLFSFLGIIALIGIIVNDGLVLVATYNDNLREGMPMMDALYEAGRSRFRPIVLTSLTTFAGLTPLLFEKSLQAQFLIPMAISVAFGLLAATVVLLLLLPALLVLVNRGRRNWFRMTNLKEKAPEYHEVEPAYKETLH